MNMNTNVIAQRYQAAINRLAKWRTVFAGWQLGTRSQGDPECDAVRDHREVTMLLRVEATALSKLLLEKGVFSMDEYMTAIAEEAELLSKDYEKRFPGFQATDIGLSVDVRQAAETTRGWKP